MNNEASPELEAMAQELIEHDRANQPESTPGMKIQNGQVVEYNGVPTNRHQRRAFAKQLRKMGLALK